MPAVDDTRHNGKVTTWNDDRGFGFITPAEPGPEIFVHIRAFEWGSALPYVGQRVSYTVGRNADGKRRAENVQPLHGTTGKTKQRPPAKDSVSYLAIPAFLLVYIIVAVLWQPPLWVPVLYVGASLICFIGYWIDKAAATAGRWRIPESTLLLPGLLGGWPGAILGQQVFRHKTKKSAFRAAFWSTVFLNVLLFVFLSSPPVQQLLTQTLEYWLGLSIV